MKNRIQLIDEVAALIRELEKPLPSDEIANGWTVESQQATLVLLRTVRTELAETRSVGKINIGRGLDGWGVEGGRLLEAACALSNGLRELAD